MDSNKTKQNMKAIKDYINESKGRSIGEFMTTILKGVKTPKETIADYLNNFEMKDLQEMSKYISETDSANYVAYQPSDDEFLKDSNKEQVIDKISQYLFKYIANA